MDIHELLSSCPSIEEVQPEDLIITEGPNDIIVHKSKPYASLIVKTSLVPSKPYRLQCLEKNFKSLSQRIKTIVRKKVHDGRNYHSESDSDTDSDLDSDDDDAFRTVYLHQDVPFYDKYGIEFDGPTGCREPMFLKKNVCLIEFSDWDDADERWTWSVCAVMFPEHVSPMGRMYEMLSYINRVVDAPGMPGCFDSFCQANELWNKKDDTEKSSSE